VKDEGIYREDVGKIKLNDDVETTIRIFESLSKFTFPRLPSQPVVLLTVPKCGTMLLRNILVHFIGPEHFYIPFVTDANYRQVLENSVPQKMFFTAQVLHDLEKSTYLRDILENSVLQKKFFTGHVLHNLETADCLRKSKVVVLVRDPRSYIMAWARFFYSVQNPKDKIMKFIQANKVPLDEAITHAILGTSCEGTILSSVRDAFLLYGLAWFNSAAVVVRYEDLLTHVKQIDSPEARKYFFSILEGLDIEPPSDWKQRVLSGADKRLSATFIKGVVYDHQKGLSKYHLDLIEVVAPNLISRLGYM
jgi:hypothetical protein